MLTKRGFFQLWLAGLLLGASFGPAPVAAQTSRRNPVKPPARRKRTPPAPRPPDVVYLPTPTETVDKMLELAQLEPGDVLYDLGSGDGRIPLAAAQKYGARAVGIEIDPQLVAAANEKARAEGLSDKVEFRQQDIFRVPLRASLREATVVTLYLSNSLNLRLRPKLLRFMRPGARIISHDFIMGDWPPEQTVRVPWQNGLFRTLYVWTVPPEGPLKRKLLRSSH